MAQPPQRAAPQVYQFRNIEPPTRPEGDRGNAAQTPALSTNYQSWKNQTDQNAAKTASHSVFSASNQNSRYGSSFSRPLDGSWNSGPQSGRSNLNGPGGQQSGGDGRPSGGDTFFRQSSSFRTFSGQNQSAPLPQQVIPNVPPTGGIKQTYNRADSAPRGNVPASSGGYVPAFIKAQRDADEKRIEEEKLKADEEKRIQEEQKRIEMEKKMEAAKKPGLDQIRLQRVALLKKQVQFYLGNELKELAELMSTACILSVNKIAEGKETRDYMHEMRIYYEDRPGAHTYRRPELCDGVEMYIDENNIDWDVSKLRGDLVGMDEQQIADCLLDWGFWRRCINGRQQHTEPLPDLLEDDVKRAFWPAVSMVPISLCLGIIIKYIIIAASCAKSSGGSVQNPLAIVTDVLASGNNFFAKLLKNSTIANVEQLTLAEIGLFCAKLGCPALGTKWALIEAMFDVFLSEKYFAKKNLILWTEGHGKDFHGRADLLMQLRHWRQWVENPEAPAEQDEEADVYNEKRTDAL